MSSWSSGQGCGHKIWRRLLKRVRVIPTLLVSLRCTWASTFQPDEPVLLHFATVHTNDARIYIELHRELTAALQSLEFCRCIILNPSQQSPPLHSLDQGKSTSKQVWQASDQLGFIGFLVSLLEISVSSVHPKLMIKLRPDNLAS